MKRKSKLNQQTFIICHMGRFLISSTQPCFLKVRGHMFDTSTWYFTSAILWVSSCEKKEKDQAEQKECS